MSKLLLPWMVVVLLAACGGDGDGGGEPAPIATDVPASAAQSADTYVAYALAMVQALADDTVEALGLAAIDAPPTSETADPVDID
jgi:hypothetical protein